jgi:hypothetical protein
VRNVAVLICRGIFKTIHWCAICVGYAFIVVSVHFLSQADLVYMTLKCTDSPCVVTYNGGGTTLLFLSAAYMARWKKHAVIIDGECASACSVFADHARQQVCITPKAKFSFHKSTWWADGKKNNFITHLYSGDILQWVQSHGGLPEKGFLTMSYNDAKQFWPTCEQ